MMEYISNNAGTIGLVFFVTAFLMIVLYALGPGRKEKIESYKHIPLSED